MDLIAYMDKLPVPGETIMGSAFQTGFGGKGANQCVAAGKLSTGAGQVGMVGAVGDDSFGKDYLQNFSNLGISTESIKVVSGVSTGVAPVWVDGNGENCIVVVPGANAAVDAGYASSTVAKHAANGSKALLTQLEIPLETTLAAMKAARAGGMLTVFTPAPAPSKPLEDGFFRNCSILVPNAIEVGALTDVDTSSKSVESVKRAAEVLLAKGCGAVVVTMGGQGSLVVLSRQPWVDGLDAIESVHIPAAKLEPGRVVDTTGAGDAFSGSLAYFYTNILLKRYSDGAFDRIVRDLLLEAVHRASVYAGDSVTKRGTQSSYASRSDPQSVLPAKLFDFSKDMRDSDSACGK